jgi:hypothetical protein
MTITIPLRSQGKRVVVTRKQKAASDAPSDFHTVEVVEKDRTGKTIQAMRLTEETADAIRRALNLLDAN